MNNIFSLSFWFDLRPGKLIAAYQNILVGLVIIMAVVAVVSFILKRNKKNLYFKLWEKAFSFAFTNTFIGLLLFFFNYEMIPFFSARFWYPLWLAGMITWLVFIVKFFESLPQKKKQIEEEKAYKKYIP
ncbi:hypothetical protein GF382_00425 [Candidatus Falkowbacteria bacterium]|nr:hypothetical protein [Candidatus Falkowbacteria bacterium]